MKPEHLLGLIVALMLTACQAGDDRSATAPGGSSIIGDGDAATASANIPDPCALFPKADLESAVGWELREGRREYSTEGSTCTFRRQQGMAATRVFPDPPLPQSTGFSSMTIGASVADQEAVAEIRKLDPDAFDDVPNLGDEAYFLGPNLLHVRVGNRGFSVRINTNPGSEADGKVRTVILALGRTGADRLR